MNALLNQKFIVAVLTAVLALLTTTGVLHTEVSDAHIAEAATLIMALAAAWFHGSTAGATVASNDVTNAAISAAQNAVGDILHEAVLRLEAAATKPAPAAPAKTVAAGVPASPSAPVATA